MEWRRCSLWPLCETLRSAGQVLGCPGCLSKKQAAPLLKFAEKHGIRRVLIEKSAPFCACMPKIDLNALAVLLKGKGFDVAFVDFPQGLENAVRETADLLGCPDKAGGILADYETAMRKTRQKMAGKAFAEEVVIIRGTYQEGTGKTFLRVEAPGGHADRFLLREMGSENAGAGLYPAGREAVKGHVPVRELDGLTAAAPDAVVMTGDAIAVQKALVKAVRENPALADVPAIRAHAVYSLPGYIDSGVIEYPMALRRWADVLERPVPGK